jgi:RNA polymerase sigma-B factor
VTDEETVDAFRRYRQSGDRQLRNTIVEEYRWIATSCAQKFRERGEPFDDLIQVGLLGLVKAVERFDPSNGTPFPGFALPTVTGELRRHFRDTTWSVHVPRRMKEVSALLTPTAERLRERLGRHPTVAELAAEHVFDRGVELGGMEASSAYRSASLHSGSGPGGPFVREPGEDDAGIDLAEARLSVQEMLGALPDRERTILYLRFFEEKTQSEIASIVGTSQVHVSRLIRASLQSLRQRAGATTQSQGGCRT